MGFKPAPSAGSSGGAIGSTTFVKPSGDATGATDVAAINAALASASVTLNGDYTVNGTIVIPSNRTLILADASITLAAATNKPIIANPSYSITATPAASQINIRGIGRAVLNYNGSNQTFQGTAFYNSCSITLVNVSQFSIEGIQFTNSQYVHVMMQGCTNGRVNRIHCDVAGADKGFVHTDFGCSNVTVDGVTASGTFSDSVFSILATLQPGLYSQFAAALTGTNRNISGITFRNINLSSGQSNTFNLWVDTGSSISDVVIQNVHNTYTGTANGEDIGIGPAGYGSLSLPARGSMSGISVENYTSGGSNRRFMTVDSDLIDFRATGIRWNGTCLGLIGNLAAPGAGYQAGYYPQVNGIKISDVDIPTLSSTGALMALVAGYQANDLQVDNVRIGTANGPVLSNAANVTGLKLSKVHVGTLNANPFQSTGVQSGVVEHFTYTAKGSSLTAILPSSTALKIVQPFPTLGAADATPSAVHASEIFCWPGKDPTGASNTYGGRYVADGSAWNLAVNLGTGFRPASLFYPLVFHFDAASLGLSNGASVASWVDASNSVIVAQATGANQPTYVAADATLNGKPSVAFNGTTQYLQNTLVTPLSQSASFTIFVVYYWTALNASSKWVFQTTLSGADSTASRYFGNTSNLGMSGGNVNLNGPTTPANNAAYVACIVQNGSAGSLGENKAAYASLSTPATAGAGTITGLTLGAGHAPANYAAVHIAEIFAYAGVISSSNYATVAAGLAAKYGVTLA